MWAAVDDAVKNPGITFHVELRLRHADGSWRHVVSPRTPGLVKDVLLGPCAAPGPFCRVLSRIGAGSPRRLPRVFSLVGSPALLPVAARPYRSVPVISPRTPVHVWSFMCGMGTIAWGLTQ